MTAPAWYPDPYNPSAYRYFDGVRLTEHVSAAAPAAMPIQPVATFQTAANPTGGHTTSVTMVNVGQPKSMGLALVLSFLFGPFGTLYGSVVGGVVLLAASVLIGWLLIPLPFIWIGSMIWAAAGVDAHNKRFGGSTMVTSQQPPTAAPTSATMAPAPPLELSGPSVDPGPYGSSSTAPHSAGPRFDDSEVVDAEIVTSQESMRSQPKMDW